VSDIALANILLAGLWLGLLLWSRASLVCAWSAHFVWNTALALLGLPVSGFTLLPPALGFGFTGARPGLLTGGTFGPEASLPCSVAFGVLTAWLMWRMVRDTARLDGRRAVIAQESVNEELASA
jgi:hypothetical protein